MAIETIHPGQLNRPLDYFKFETVVSDTSEHTRTEVLMGKLWTQRIDVSGTEEVEGKVLPLKVCRFICRYSNDLALNGESYFLRDVDGDFQVNSIRLTGQGRNRFIELRCSSRGKD